MNGYSMRKSQILISPLSSPEARRKRVSAAEFQEMTLMSQSLATQDMTGLSCVARTSHNLIVRSLEHEART